MEEGDDNEEKLRVDVCSALKGMNAMETEELCQRDGQIVADNKHG